MKYEDATAFRQALEQRLKDRADGDGARLARDRKRVAFDRLLARLLAVASRQWLLKGGFALDLRLTTRARSTKDIDIEWRAGEEELLNALLDAASHDAGDFFTFAIERAGVPEDRLGGSHRFRVSASLAGRPFETGDRDLAHRGSPGFRRDRAGQGRRRPTGAAGRRKAPRLHPHLRGRSHETSCVNPPPSAGD